MNLKIPRPVTRVALTTLPFFILAVFLIVYSVPEVSVPPQLPQPRVLGESSPPASNPPAAAATGPVLKGTLNLDSVRAKSLLVYDVASDDNLAQRAESFPLPIASLTKLMTGFVVSQNTDLRGETAVITPADLEPTSPGLGVRPGDHIKVADLFNAMLIGSANDAAKTLGNFISAKLKVPAPDLMNQQAAYLGMDDTHFSNAIGFDSETNYSTAADLKLLVNAIQTSPAFDGLGRKTSYQFTSQEGHSYSVEATNKLLSRDPEISAIKTGYTDQAQGAMITEVNHLGHRFIIIVLDSPDREGDTLRLKKTITESYQW